MQLNFKGASYTYKPQLLETVETDVICQFLGNTRKLRVVKQAPTHRNQNRLKYRGVNYLG